ncbi:MAG: SPASM domain-containing protein [Oscillospiraceae bacterium]|nr:SPASM domain-containing protein [Oscillospiraceae bacterium]
MRFRKIYVEISNLCNLSCAFCPGTKRSPGRMTPEDFAKLLPKLRPYTDFLYFHIMGEPLCHPHLAEFLEMAHGQGFRVILTTNGTLLAKQQEMLLSAPGLHKINISLHAFEANDLAVPFEEYLADCFRFGKAAEGKKLVVYRLWNKGGADAKNEEILSVMEKAFPKPWVVENRGTRIADRVFLEYGEKFDWPDLGAPEGSEKLFCYGLRDQLGVLWDGTVVPCCLDHEGDLALGNLFDREMEEILQSPRAKAIYEGFSRKEAVEELCRRCGYARRFE